MGDCASMEKQLVIKEYEDKVAKNGKPYTRFKTEDNQWISSFNQATITKLKERLGRNLIVNVFTSMKEGFDPIETIANFVRDVDEAVVIDMTKVPNLKVDTSQEKKITITQETALMRENRQWAEMAKEIYLSFVLHDTANLPGSLTTAIEITKKLREEFK